jgi:hypothetical protein
MVSVDLLIEETIFSKKQRFSFSKLKREKKKKTKRKKLEFDSPNGQKFSPHKSQARNASPPKK